MATGNDFSLMCTTSGVQRNMIVLKFGGTSVGKPEHMKKIAELVSGTPGKKIIVLSALSGW